MRAVALSSFEGSPAVIDVAEPVAGPGEVLVRVRGASVNAYDVGVAAGAMKDYLPYEFPAVIGNDVAGTIEAIGDGVEGYAVGDRVFGTIGSKAAIDDGSSRGREPGGGGRRDGAGRAVGRRCCIARRGRHDGDECVDAVGPAEGHRTGPRRHRRRRDVRDPAATRRGAHVIASVRPGDEGFVTDLGAAETIDYTGDVIATFVIDSDPTGSTR